jgi:hypothetical protein
LRQTEYVPPEDREKIQSLKRSVKIKDRMMDVVQNCDSCKIIIGLSVSNILRLRSEPNRLMLSIGLSQFWTLELEFFLLPTVSRPVGLGIGPPFGTLDQILACSSFCDNYVILLSMRPL